MALKKIACFFLFLIFLNGLANAQDTVKNPDPHRYQPEIDTFMQWDAKNSFPHNAILFAGSSSIRFWNTHNGFPDLPVINRGFGGSHISDLQYYYDRVIKKYHPAVIVFYCGDNDVAAGKPVRQVVNDYKQLTGHIRHDFPDIRFVYLPIKPSSSRFQYWPQMEKVNQEIKTYNRKYPGFYYVDTASPLLGSDGKPDDSLFRDDHLHLNKKGYAIWNHILSDTLKNIFNNVSSR